jgi:hypothetical protein
MRKPSPGYWSIQTCKAFQEHEETITRILEYTDS